MLRVCIVRSYLIVPLARLLGKQHRLLLPFLGMFRAELLRATTGLHRLVVFDRKFY